MIINYKVELMGVRNKYEQRICLRYWSNISWEESCWELTIQTGGGGAHNPQAPITHAHTHTHTHTHEYTICKIMWNWQVLLPFVAETTGNHKTFYHAQIITNQNLFSLHLWKNLFCQI
jgi:hypothetical protein